MVFKDLKGLKANKIIPILVILFVIVVSAVYYLQFKVQPQPTMTTTTSAVTTSSTTTTTAPPTGDLMIAVKDVQHKIVGDGYMTGLNLTINAIEVHFVGQKDENDTGEWITVFNGTKSVDLLAYTDIIAIVGEKELNPGKYTQIRFDLGDGYIKIYDAFYQNIYNKTYPLVVPSNELKLIHPFTIDAGKTLVITADFNVDKIVTRPGGVYSLRPVEKTLADYVNVSEQILEKGQIPDNSRVV